MDNQPEIIDSVEKRCDRCRFATLLDTDPNTLQRVRICRRFPPAPLVMMTNQGPVFSAQTPNAQPMVHAEHWCFEFQPGIPASVAAISHEKPPPKIAQN